MNNAHLVVVNNDTFAIHMQNQFCAFKAAEGLGHWGQLADLMSVRRGDLIFFYLNYISEKNLLYPLNKFLPGYYGIYRVSSNPFVQEEDVLGHGEFDGQAIFGNSASKEYAKFKRNDKWVLLLPLRFEIEPIKGLSYFRPVPDNVAYVDKTDEGQLWTLLFKKISKAGLNRGITPLLPEEASKIARLLFKESQTGNARN